MKRTICHIVWISIVSLFVNGCAIPGSLEKTDYVRQLEAQAENGDVESQYQLGLHYAIDSEWALDHHRGYRWFVLAADAGHADAQYMAGVDKLHGVGTLVDKKGAVEYFRLAALQGHARAQYQLGVAYLNGAGVDQDKPWGRQWLEQAAWHEHKEAQFLLGALFSGGVGGQKNRSEAWRWLKRADANEHKLAAVALGNLSAKMSSEEMMRGKMLLNQTRPEKQVIYQFPRIRYVQTVLNQLGYFAGDEDGLVGPKTLSAAADYAEKNNLPREASMIILLEHLRGS